MELTQKYIMDNKQIMITYDLIDAVKSSESLITWDDMVYIMERLSNDLPKDSTLGHVISKDGRNYVFMKVHLHQTMHKQEMLLCN